MVTTRNSANAKRFRKILFRDEPPCAVNGCQIDYAAHHLAPNAPQLDHVVPLTRGGPDTLDNCQVVCRKCNRAKSDRVDISVRFETERVW